MSFYGNKIEIREFVIMLVYVGAVVFFVFFKARKLP